MAIAKVHYNPAEAITAKCKADVKAGTFVEIAGPVAGRNPLVQPAKAEAQALGVAATDGTKDGHVTVLRIGHVVDVVAAAKVDAGDKISADADGKAKKTASGPVLGVAISNAAKEDDTVTVALL